MELSAYFVSTLDYLFLLDFILKKKTKYSFLFYIFLPAG